ncbi:MAG: heparinase II/III family protein [Actinobacteria bacterium]|nr:heparinase II/III family protein [Actinomycetota bacterium]
MLASGRIELLGHERSLSQWRPAEAPQLWRYHLHYWDWAWSLVHDADRPGAQAVFRRLFREWQAQTQFGRWDEWSPYVVSLRAWSWCGQFEPLVRGTDLEEELVRLLALHTRFLRAHLELDAGGNHLIKNLVLPDGGHEERAPAYHCQVLGDLIDVEGLLAAEAPPWLRDAVARMRTWLGLVLLPTGDVPLLNDGFPVDATFLDLLEPGPAAPDGLTLLPESGLAVLRRGKWHVLADVGPPCPEDLPAHAHADTLGFLLHHRTLLVVGEAFTSTYAPGAVRAAERSTGSHSTVQVDGQDSTEVWGAFRAGRRARVGEVETGDHDGMVTLSAQHDGYRHLPGGPRHRRTWRLSAEGLTVVDVVDGSGQHDLVLRFHRTTPRDVAKATGPLSAVPANVAAGWETRHEGSALEHTAHARLPWRFETQLREAQA